MTDINTENLVGMLREKTEEADLQQYLISTFGGYTKKSVQKYIALLRKQQQTTADTFNHNLQTLLEEKESLKASNEKLTVRLSKAESQYQNLSESMLTYKIENKELSIQDIISLKNKIAALEGEGKKKDSKIRELEKEVERQQYAMQEKNKKLQKSEQETSIIPFNIRTVLKRHLPVVAIYTGFMTVKETILRLRTMGHS